MRFREIITNIEKNGAWSVFILIIIIAGSAALAAKLPATDIAEVYAPAAEAFARGDWKYAFHPRIGVFYPALTGSIVWISGWTGESACQAASILLFALCCFPLFATFEMIWDRRTAFAAVLLTAGTSHIVRFVAEGLRDSGKCLGLALMAYGLCCLVRNRRSLWAGIVFTFGAALLVMLRGEGGIIVVVCGVYACKLVGDWKRIAAGILLFLLLLLPQLLYNFKVLGYPVPELRYAVVMQESGIPPFRTPEVEIPESAL